ncbi:MAG: hypothetical protein ACFE8J_03855 [Candidatus Heimdallarchaeota archaeon]
MKSIGSTLGYVGGSLLIITGIIAIIFWGFLEGLLPNNSQIIIAFLDYIISSGYLNAYGLSMFLTFMWGIMALIAVKMKKKFLLFGNIMLVIVGLIASILIFIPIRSTVLLDLGSDIIIPLPAVKLSMTYIFVDPFLILIGGIIGIYKKN